MSRVNPRSRLVVLAKGDISGHIRRWLRNEATAYELYYVYTHLYIGTHIYK